MHHAHFEPLAMQAGYRRLAALLRYKAPSTAEFFPSVGGVFASSSVSRVRVFGEGLSTAAAAGDVPRKTRWLRRVGNVVAGVGAVSAAAWIANGEYPLRRVTLLYQVPIRLARDVATATAMIAGPPPLLDLCV